MHGQNACELVLRDGRAAGVRVWLWQACAHQATCTLWLAQNSQIVILHLLVRRQRRSDDGADVSGQDEATRRTAKLRRRAQREERRAALIQYYGAGSGWGRPASALLYELAHQFSLDDSLLLWCAHKVLASTLQAIAVTLGAIKSAATISLLSLQKEMSEPAD